MPEVTQNYAQGHKVPFKEYEFGGLRVHSVTSSTMNQYIQDVLAANQLSIIFGYSLTIIPKLGEQPEIATLGNQYDVLVPDGKGFFWMANFFGANLDEHLSIPDLVAQSIVLSNEKGYRVYLLGATKEVNEKAQELTSQKYPKLIINGRDGYFKEHELDRIVEDIQKKQPDIILIGISSPIKERLALILREKLSRGVIIPCGGVIDILGEKTKREPEFVKKIGMTWIYRFIQEPKRLLKPVMYNGMYFLGVLFPVIFWKRKVLKNTDYGFLDWYGKR